MKVLLINNQFCIGGAGRVAAILCNELFSLGVDLHIVTDNINWPVSYSVDKSIEILPIDLNPRRSTLFQKFKKAISCIVNIRHYIKRVSPDAIIAIQADMFVRSLIANIGTRIPLIAADHNSFANFNYSSLINRVRHSLYRYADGLSILTKKDQRLLGDKFPRKEVIYNPLPFPPSKGKTVREKVVLCVGRLDAWRIKGLDTIIDMWSEMEGEFPDWSLSIAGTGEMESVEYIKNLISSHGLDGRVKLLGLVGDMRSLYEKTEIFALPSRFEGFPMALMEAMSQGCACVAFEVQKATNEMMNEECGIIVRDGDNDDFKKGLMRLMGDASLRSKFSAAAMAKSSEFTADKFGKHWLEYLHKVINIKH